MTQITADLDDKLLKEFRDVIYRRFGLRRGDFKKSLEEAITEYIEKHQNAKTGSYNNDSFLIIILNSHVLL